MTEQRNLLSTASDFGSLPVTQTLIRPDDVREDENGCWIWQGYIYARTGYGIASRGGRSMHAHRWMWKQLIGPIPEGHHLHHRCHVRACVNPNHLEPIMPVPHLRRHRRGVSKLTPEQIAEIRVSTKTQRELRAEYGVVVAHIHALETWADIDGPTRPEAYCAHCGDLITTGRRHKRYCTVRCREAANQLKMNEKAKARRRAAREAA